MGGAYLQRAAAMVNTSYIVRILKTDYLDVYSKKSPRISSHCSQLQTHYVESSAQLSENHSVEFCIQFKSLKTLSSAIMNRSSILRHFKCSCTRIIIRRRAGGSDEEGWVATQEGYTGWSLGKWLFEIEVRWWKSMGSPVSGSRAPTCAGDEITF